MNIKNLKKGTEGYIDNKKKIQLILTSILFIAALSIFIIGFFLNNKEKNNVFSIIAVLMMLPAAKALVGYIVIFKYKSVSKEKREPVININNKSMIILEDLVITSSEKVMNLDFIAIINHQVIGVIGRENQDVSYIKTYLTRTLKNQGYEYSIAIFKDFQPFINRISTIEEKEISEKDTEVKNLILTLNV